jgi:hypothetical protein
MGAKPVGLPPPPGIDNIQPSTKDKVLGGIGGFMSAGAGLDFKQTPLGQKLQQHHDAQVSQAEMYWKLAQTAGGEIATKKDSATGRDLTPEEIESRQHQYQAAMDAYGKIVGVNKETKAAHGKARMVLDHLLGRGQGQPQQGAQPQPQGQVPPAGAGNPGGGPPVPPTASAGAGATPTTAAKGMPAPPNRMSPEQMAGAYPSPQVQGEQDFSAWKRQADVLHQQRMEEEEAKIKATTAAKAASPSTPPRPVIMRDQSVRDARELAKNMGKVYEDKEGKPINLESLPDEMSLTPYTIRVTETDDQGNSRQAWKIRYEPHSPNQKTITIGNEQYATNPADVSKIPEGAGTALGPKNTPRTSSHTAPGIDPMTGTIGNVTTTSVTTPQTTGARGRRGIPAPPRQAQPAGQPPAQPPAAPRGNGARPSATAVPPTSGDAGKPQFIPFAAAGQIRQAVIPVREGATQIFGDPTQPQLKSLKDFAPLFDNAASRRRVGKALRLTLDGIQDNVESSGGLLEWMRIKTGLPQALADARARAMSSVKEKLTPQEQDAYNALMSAYGAVIGLRSLTKASAAKFSVQRLEQELPLPGVNSTSSRDYYDQLSRLAEQVYNGTRMLPMPENEKTYYGQQVSELRKLKEAPPSKLSPAAQQFLDQIK